MGRLYVPALLRASCERGHHGTAQNTKAPGNKEEAVPVDNSLVALNDKDKDG